VAERERTYGIGRLDAQGVCTRTLIPGIASWSMPPRHSAGDAGAMDHVTAWLDAIDVTAPFDLTAATHATLGPALRPLFADWPVDPATVTGLSPAATFALEELVRRAPTLRLAGPEGLWVELH
jgi:hypothetical protein